MLKIETAAAPTRSYRNVTGLAFLRSKTKFQFVTNVTWNSDYHYPAFPFVYCDKTGSTIQILLTECCFDLHAEKEQYSNIATLKPNGESVKCED